jgi:hypothetical protein
MAMNNEPLVLIAGEQQLTTVGGRQVDVDHLHGGKLFQHAARRQPRRQRVQAARLLRCLCATSQVEAEQNGQPKPSTDTALGSGTGASVKAVKAVRSAQQGRPSPQL